MHSRTAALVVMTALLAGSSAGCVTAAGVWKRDSEVGLPLLVGAVAADIVVTSVLASQVQDFTVGATIATDLAVTAVDVGVGCLVGACRVLRL